MVLTTLKSKRTAVRRWHCVVLFSFALFRGSSPSVEVLDSSPPLSPLDAMPVRYWCMPRIHTNSSAHQRFSRLELRMRNEVTYVDVTFTLRSAADLLARHPTDDLTLARLKKTILCYAFTMLYH